jgi:hypothetical protein
MKFEQLYPNFLSLSDEERFEFFSDYYHRRSIDLTETLVAKVTTKKERTKGKTEKKITVSKDQFALLKQLGLC